MNIYDIAELAGVSIATVSRVVNNSPKVSEKTKERVLKIIEIAGYTPNVFAQGLGLNTMHTIGILVPSISDIYMANAVAYLEEMIHSHGYNCILGCSGFSAEQKNTHIQMLLSKRIDALILVGSTYAGSDDNSHNTDYIRDAAKQAPVFLINGLTEGENIFCTATNDYQASYDVVASMIKKEGRKKILFLTDSQSYSAKKKKAGYEQALIDAGIGVDESLIIRAKNDIHFVRDLLLENGPADFDAVYAAEDGMAVGALKYAMEKGISVPKDMSIVGYNNSSLCVCSSPELTSIDNRLKDVCTDTVTRLFSVLSGDTDLIHANILTCTLAKRETTSF